MLTLKGKFDNWEGIWGEMKALSKKRGNKGPMGRAISLMEMTQVMLNYPQIYTDMSFLNIPTIPLELRAGV